MSSVYDLIESISPAVAVKLFWINDPNTICIVKSGALDIFLQEQDAQGASVGARYHVFRVVTGQPFIGLDFSHLPEGWGAIAVPLPGTKLSRITTDEFSQSFQLPEMASDALELLSEWVSNTASGITKPMPPKYYRPLQTGTSIEVETEETLSPEEPIVWVRLREGNLLWMGQKALVVDDNSGPFPLTHDSFLRAESKSLVDVFNPIMLITDGAIWQAMQTHLQFVLRYALLIRDEVADLESERLQAMEGVSLTQTHEAMSRLMGLDQKQKNYGSAPQNEDLLFKALRLIGDTQGMDFKVPPPAEAEALKRNPLETICAASEIRYRLVALKEEWWAADNGPLLATIGESKQWVALLPLADSSYEIYNPASGHRQALDQASIENF